MSTNLNIEDEIKNNEIKLEEMQQPDQEKFLFFFTPEKIDTECIGGVTLKNGVRILSVIVFYEGLSSLAISLNTKSNIKFILSLLFFIFYLCVGCSALYSTFNDNISLAKISYFILCIIFIIQTIFYFLQFTVRLIEFINPWDGDFLKIKIIIYILGNFAYLFIFLYFIYVLFCFINSLKKTN